MNYDKLQATALRLLESSGRDITRRAYTAGTYDPATGETSRTSADTTRSGVLLNFGKNVTHYNGTLIQESDKKLIVDATAAISTKDHFIVGSTEYEVISIAEVNPAGTSLVNILHVRGV